MELTMTGRCALITGASKGLGLATARRFVGAGASVALVARSAEPLAAARAQLEALARTGESAAGVKIIAIEADVSTAAGCEHAMHQAVTELGGVDVLVNNAGTSQTGAFETITDAVWQADLDLKLFAAIRLSRAAMPAMQSKRWGRIINVLNTGAKVPAAGMAPTAVSRAAGMALTKVLAGEGAAHNVLVNALLVGRIESDQWERRAQTSGRPVAQVYAEMAAALPMGRVGTAEEFANMACFLASDQGSYINGAAINVDGGLCAVV